MNKAAEPQYLEKRSLVRKIAQLDEEEEEKKPRVEREKQPQVIKNQNTGFEKKPKKRVIKASERFRSCLDWDKSDDTSSIHINSNPRMARLLFGHGSCAGIHIHLEEQNKDLHYFKKVLHDMTPKTGEFLKRILIFLITLLQYLTVTEIIAQVNKTRRDLCNSLVLMITTQQAIMLLFENGCRL